MLEGENKFECEELKKKIDAKKRTFFLEMPNIFIVNLKRFEYDIEIQNRKKLNDYFEFPF